MGVIIKKVDVSNDVMSKVVNSLNQDADDAENLISCVENFCTRDHDKLKGSTYDLIRKKLSDNYIPALKDRANLCRLISDCIQKSCGVMNGFMEDYDDLNDSLLPAVREQYIKALNSYNYLKGILDSDNEPILQNMDLVERKQYLGYFASEMRELKRLMAKLEDLSPTDLSTYRIFDSSKNDLNKYESRVRNMGVTSIKIVSPSVRFENQMVQK